MEWRKKWPKTGAGKTGEGQARSGSHAGGDAGQTRGRNRGETGAEAERSGMEAEKEGGRVAWQPRGWRVAGRGIVNAGAGTAWGWGGGGYRGSCRKPFAAAWSGEPVRLRGLEWGRKHTRWAYTHALDTKTPEGNGAVRAFESGGQGRNRTTDTRIFSPLLYQLSYLAFVRQQLNNRCCLSTRFYPRYFENTNPACSTLEPARGEPGPGLSWCVLQLGGEVTVS